ncbi:MAG TPA: MucR family transcriptional regulator, partial [Sphingobium sp.]|nr:MucR family transcriptional regulator [Sphingobium sp.]
MAEEIQSDITALAVQLLSAFVSKNTVPAESLAGLIKSTRAALMDEPAAQEKDVPDSNFTPAVSVRKSLSSPDHILSLIDGKPYKTLKRHLTFHGLTADQYRARYNLPEHYPLVAPSYSEARRSVAEKHGLGRKPAVAAGVAKPAKAAATGAAASGQGTARTVAKGDPVKGSANASSQPAS